FHAKRLPVDDAEEAVADMNTGMRLELTALDRVIYAEQDRHLDGAGRMEPPFRVEAPLDAVVEVVEGNGDVLRARLLGDREDLSAQRVQSHPRPFVVLKAGARRARQDRQMHVQRQPKPAAQPNGETA